MGLEDKQLIWQPDKVWGRGVRHLMIPRISISDSSIKNLKFNWTSWTFLAAFQATIELVCYVVSATTPDSHFVLLIYSKSLHDY